MKKYYKGCDGVLFMMDREFNKNFWYTYGTDSWNIYSYNESPVKFINETIPGRNYTITELSAEEIREELFMELL